MSRKTSAQADKAIIRTEHVNFLRDEATASSWLLAYGTSTIKVMINAGGAYFGSTKVEFDGGYSPLMTAPTASSRIDVVSMSSTPEIVITVGTEADTPTAPTPPTSDIPICEVYNKAGEVKITDTDEGAGEGYINKDLRNFVQLVPVSLGIVKIKTADESIITSNTLQNDDDLFQAIAANEKWIFEFVLFVAPVAGGANGDMKVAMTIPSGATMKFNVLSGSGPGSTNVFHYNATLITSGGSSGEITIESNLASIVILRGSVMNGATAGNVQLQWAQLAVADYTLTVQSHSYMKANKIV